MAKFFFANGTEGARALNLDLVQWASKNVDGDVFLSFGKDDHLTLRDKDAELCWETINQMWAAGGGLGNPAESRTERSKVGATVSNYSPALRARRLRRP